MTNPELSLYKLIGGEIGLRALVERFYDVMASAPEAKDVRALHGASLKQSREKLFMFLSRWSGGPSLYIEKYGHPRLRQQHMPFPIGKTERDQWLWCMDKALAESSFDAQLIEYLKGRFTEIANSMQNRVNIDL